jgi:endonuclease/exonuclease/phosphatase family metal-dependent hydrolase
MSWVYVALLLLVGTVVSTVSGQPSLAMGDGFFRVATFNIHHGADRRNTYSLDRTIAAIAALDADVVGLQEVVRFHPAWNCDDQPPKIADGLLRATGQRWSYVYTRSFSTGERSCMASGRGTGPDEEGLAFFARERIVASKSLTLTEQRSGLLVQLASLPGVPIVTTHLVAGRQNQEARAREAEALLAWAARYGRGLLLGDLNATPDAGEIAGLRAKYRDAWDVALVEGRIDPANGPTFPAGLAARPLPRLPSATSSPDRAPAPGRRGRRIDYVLYDPRLHLQLVALEVVDTASPELGLPDVSDHRPIVATFRIGPGTVSAD